VKYDANEDNFEAINYLDWTVGFSRTWSSLRIWYVLRSFGISGMQRNIREKIELAKYFEELVNKSKHFELFIKRQLALVCFSYINENMSQDELNVKN